MWRSLVSSVINNVFRPHAAMTRTPQLCLDGLPAVGSTLSPGPMSDSSIFGDIGLWFAVPKKRVSKSKKRKKTTAQYRIKVKENIVIDRGTGDMTLMHKLPQNWKDYIPEVPVKRDPRTGAPVEVEESKGGGEEKGSSHSGGDVLL